MTSEFVYFQTFTIAAPNTGGGTIFKGSTITTYPLGYGATIGDCVTGKTKICPTTRKEN